MKNLLREVAEILSGIFGALLGSKKGKKLLPLILVAVVLVCLIGSAVIKFGKHSSAKAEAKEGVAYLKELEEKDTSEVQAQISAIQKEKRMKQIEENPDAIWGAFNDAVIIGDSRAVGFSTYELLPSERVLARTGGRITDVEGYISNISTLQPQQVFMCFGLNDIGMYSDVSAYMEDYLEQTKMITEAVPDAQILVCSILPSYSSRSIFDVIPEYNEELSKLCDENGWTFVDSTATGEEHKDMYESDGLHFSKSFYAYWANDMISEVL